MWLPYDNDQQLTSGERWTVALLLLFFVGMFGAELATNFHPVKLTALFFVLWWGPLMILHEVGHALMASCLGWYVGRVSLGMGPLVRRFQISRTLVDVRLYPVEGFVQPVPMRLRKPQLESALIYFAGPGIELLLLVLLALLVGPRELYTHSDHIGVMIAQGAALVITVSTFVNLIPHYAPMSSLGLVPNDGMGILRSFQHPDSYYADQIGQTIDPNAEAWKGSDQGADGEEEWKEYNPADWWKR
jgi:hypothetical protein